tara:strand:+ start:448 stop:642 length:195 start_codon:yes stop_codon:yes gene_type:complete
LKEKEDSTDLVLHGEPDSSGLIEKLPENIIEAEGDRMTPEMMRELISKNPDRVCAALRSWTLTK